MKPLLILARVIFVGIFWSILFLEGIRVIMLSNWHFDIFRTSHWLYAWNLWLSGWVIDDPKEWAFILIFLTFIPVWLTGWTALSMIQWGKVLNEILSLPLVVFSKLFEKQVKKITSKASVKVVKKKKSYKEIRPKSIRPPMEESTYSLPQDKKAALSGIPPSKSTIRPGSSVISKPVEPKEFDHSLFKFDDNDNDLDFDLFGDNSETPKAETKKVEEPKKENNEKNKNPIAKDTRKPQESSSKTQQAKGGTNSTLEQLKQKGYEVITGATIKNTLIDFIGISANQICLCLNDKEPGDWLADEERFNDEEPLWFSESSHRISPVRKIDTARNILKEKLESANFNFNISAYVIIQIGNIINAEDMFEIWDNMDINVTRIDRGTPKEIKLFAKALEDAEEKITKDNLEKIKKLIRNI